MVLPFSVPVFSAMFSRPVTLTVYWRNGSYSFLFIVACELIVESFDFTVAQKRVRNIEMDIIILWLFLISHVSNIFETRDVQAVVSCLTSQKMRNSTAPYSLSWRGQQEFTLSKGPSKLRPTRFVKLSENSKKHQKHNLLKNIFFRKERAKTIRIHAKYIETFVQLYLRVALCK